VVARFCAPVQTGPGAHPASCTIDTGSFPGVKSGRNVTLTLNPVLVPWSWKSRAIPLLPLWAIRPVLNLSTCTKVHFTFYVEPVSIEEWYSQRKSRNIRKKTRSALTYSVQNISRGPFRDRTRNFAVYVNFHLCVITRVRQIQTLNMFYPVIYWTLMVDNDFIFLCNIILPPVGHSSNHQYRCCRLTDNRDVVRNVIALLSFSRDSPSCFSHHSETRCES